jgi:hypothetical protein
MDIESRKRTASANALKLAGGVLLIVGFLSCFLNPLLMIIPAYVGYLLLRRAKKYDVARAASVLQADGRPPVIYLRSFKEEELESAPLYRFRNAWLDKQTWLSDTVANNSVQEQDALGYVFRKIGPYIALGRPGEELPELGSSKLYVSNGEWQGTVRKLLDRSRLVVFEAGITDSLKWELAEIVRTVIPQKILMILPVKEQDYFSFIQWANYVMPVPLPAKFPSSRLVMFVDTWIPSYLPRERTWTETLTPFLEMNGIVVKESYWGKLLEHNGVRW